MFGGRSVRGGVVAGAVLAVVLALGVGAAEAKVKHFAAEQRAQANAQNETKGAKAGPGAAAKHGGMVTGTVVTRGGKIVRGSRVVVTRVSGRHVVHRARTGAAGHFQVKVSPAIFRVTASKAGMGRSTAVQLAVAPGGHQDVQLYLRPARHHALVVGHHHRFRLGHKGVAATDSAMQMNQRASQIPGNPFGNAPGAGTVAKPGAGTVAKQGPGVINGGSTVNNPNVGKK